MLKKTFFTLSVLIVSQLTFAQNDISEVWVSDNGDGTFKNPIIHADYSDPDVVAVGDDFYMTSSSFNCAPGLPILHSKDLVNWELINYAINKQVPEDVFDKPQHGNGVWAPCIRFHNNEYYIYFPDPDFGIYMTKTKDPAGQWSEPVLVKGGKGLIDPAPLWDEDGKVYLAYAFAGSRAGVKSILLLTEMNSDGTKAIGEDVMLFDGHDAHPTVEGPKFYKRNGYYYIFAPAGGVSTGWQLVLRSKNIYGPYEEKIVMAQGKTEINGPHQGAWVTTNTGEDWFIHFQDREAYGRIVHLQPMVWKNDWPIIGEDKDGDGVGQPVLVHKKPNVGKTYPITTVVENDEFNGHKLGVQWQWHANRQLYFGYSSGNLGYFRLNSRPVPEGATSLWQSPNILAQKFTSNKFTATTKVTFNSPKGNDEAGFIVMGDSYQFISLKNTEGKTHLRVVQCNNARTGGTENELYSEEFEGNEIYFRVTVEEGAVCSFSYSTNGKRFKTVGEEFHAVPGRWIGAKVGYFARRNDITNDAGTLDIDWYRVTKK